MGWQICAVPNLKDGDRVRLVTTEEFVYSTGVLSASTQGWADERPPLRVVHGIPSAAVPVPTFRRTVERWVEDATQAGAP